MSEFSVVELMRDKAAIIIPILLVLLGLIVLYFVLLVRTILQMLQHRVSSVLLTFAFLSLVPFPLTLVMGILILIIWHYHRKDLLTG